MSTSIYQFFLLLSLISIASARPFIPKFRDVTIKAGIDITPEGPGTRKLLKYGGPTIADLDRDGFYDLIFVHHGSAKFEIYFNNGDGTFTKSPIGVKRDIHAITPVLLPGIRDCFFVLVPGGNAGNRPNPPVVFRVRRNRRITDATELLGVDHFTARGRTVITMPFRKRRTRPDMLFLNADASPANCPGCTDGQWDAYVYTGKKPLYQPLTLKGFNPTWQNSQSLAIDPNGDGKLELLTWRNLTIHKMTGFFRSKDVTRSFLGKNAYQISASVVEIDFDNDGDFDLYVARDKLGLLNATKGVTLPDMLLENRGGRYVNVAVEAGIPQNTISRGVTAGDFNNDRWMDLYVTVFRGGQDFMLLNNRDGTFRKVDIRIKKAGARGDNALAVDYDNDGRVDLIRSEGSWGDLNYGGQFRILKNVPRAEDRNGRWIKVKVGEARGQTSLHAVVVVWADGVRMMQRVGQAGVQTPHSYLDTLHFGIGKAKRVFVKVAWLNGLVKRRRINAGQTTVFGRFIR